MTEYLDFSSCKTPETLPPSSHVKLPIREELFSPLIGGGSGFSVLHPQPHPCEYSGISVYALLKEKNDIHPCSIVYPNQDPKQIHSLSLSYFSLPKKNIFSDHSTVSIGEVLRIGLGDDATTIWDFTLLQITRKPEGSQYLVTYLGGSTSNLPALNEHKVVHVRFLPNLGQSIDYPGPLEGTFIHSNETEIYTLQNVNNIDFGSSDPGMSLKILGKLVEIQVQFEGKLIDQVQKTFSFELVFSVSQNLPGSFGFLAVNEDKTTFPFTCSFEKVGNTIVLHFESTSAEIGNSLFSGKMNAILFP